jgi:hypothetical protein
VLVAEFPSSPWGSTTWVAEGGGLAFAPHTEVPYQPRGSAKVATMISCMASQLGYVKVATRGPWLHERSKVARVHGLHEKPG